MSAEPLPGAEQDKEEELDRLWNEALEELMRDMERPFHGNHASN